MLASVCACQRRREHIQYLLRKGRYKTAYKKTEAHSEHFPKYIGLLYLLAPTSTVRCISEADVLKGKVLNQTQDVDGGRRKAVNYACKPLFSALNGGEEEGRRGGGVEGRRGGGVEGRRGGGVEGRRGGGEEGWRGGGEEGVFWLSLSGRRRKGGGGGEKTPGLFLPCRRRLLKAGRQFSWKDGGPTVSTVLRQIFKIFYSVNYTLDPHFKLSSSIHSTSNGNKYYQKCILFTPAKNGHSDLGRTECGR
ncbi:hypothetical protein BaRGS_00006421 [Batillaria attramentaria]|uniref:Uncharacterized protein n=1 Tax=Batillaria attramentaria TaxID=370345 RepID=A0ABD0LTG6_9CAEN